MIICPRCGNKEFDPVDRDPKTKRVTCPAIGCGKQFDPDSIVDYLHIGETDLFRFAEGEDLLLQHFDRTTVHRPHVYLGYNECCTGQIDRKPVFRDTPGVHDLTGEVGHNALHAEMWIFSLAEQHYRARENNGRISYEAEYIFRLNAADMPGAAAEGLLQYQAAHGKEKLIDHMGGEIHALMQAETERLMEEGLKAGKKLQDELNGETQRARILSRVNGLLAQKGYTLEKFTVSHIETLLCPRCGVPVQKGDAHCSGPQQHRLYWCPVCGELVEDEFAFTCSKCESELLWCNSCEKFVDTIRFCPFCHRSTVHKMRHS